MDSLLRLAAIILDMSGGFVWHLEDHDLHSRRYAMDCGRGLNKVPFLHVALASLLFQRWYPGLIVFSGAVSMKMNVTF